MKSSLTNSPLWLFAFVIMWAHPHSSLAQVFVTTTQPLNFGTFAIADFSTTAVITINTDGSHTTNANTVALINPTRGEYNLSSTFLNATYTIMTPTDVTLSGPGGTFLMDNITVRPTTLLTDGAGNDSFNISARLVSQGGGTSYGNGTYNNNFDIIITF